MSVTNTKYNPRLEGQTRVKWVRKASQWCTTTFKDGKQTQTWTQVKPEKRKNDDPTIPTPTKDC